MKKLNLALAAVAALSMASCSSDEPAVNATSDGATTFTLTIPANAASRAMGDGQDIVGKVNLNYSVFQIDASAPTAVGTFVTSGKETTPFQKDASGNTYSTTLSLNLAKGQTYNVVFWAANPGQTAYTWTANTATVAVDYSKMATNNDLLDAYFGTAASVTPGTAASATLKRPFAQLNLLTSDYDDVFVKKAYGDGLANLTTSVKVKASDVNTNLNLFTGVATGNPANDITFTAVASQLDLTSTPNKGLMDINGTNYAWLTMDYLLVNANQSVADCEWAINANGTQQTTVSVPACPVQRNYQTNVYGALLTNPTDLNVTINPAFDGSENIVPNDGSRWDGVTTEPIPNSAINLTNKTATIANAAQLAWLAGLWNKTVTYDANTTILPDPFEKGATAQGGKRALRGWSFKLATDIDLNNQPWTPIENPYCEIDGQGHTIYNMKVTGTKNVGFISTVFTRSSNYDTETVKILSNLNFVNATVTGEDNVGVLVGFDKVMGVFSNCKVSNSSVTTTKRGGIAAGMLYGIVENCTVENCTVNGKFTAIAGQNNVYENAKQVGLLVGHVGESSRSNRCQILNNKVIGGEVTGYQCVGGLLGIAYGSSYTNVAGTAFPEYYAIIKNNSVTGTVLKVAQLPAGGTYNAWWDAKTSTSVEPLGKLTLQHAADKFGALIGDFETSDAQYFSGNVTTDVTVPQL